MDDLASLAGSLSLRQGRSLVYGNRHSAAPAGVDEKKGKEEKNVHQWTAFVEEKGEWGEGEGIHKVEFHLHPTFDPALVCCNQAPFQVTRR